ncbi:hypothetical protein [Actinomadura rugatobispora]|uniref:ABC transporter permease n=1 Tax=Actinomadura rugatobispora TaxID=1994 RepID=A0ABW0ZYY1_9ACTN|nr:hypothetical protein GCM10010200_056100 [Actinomadura rugatobispora]
MPPAGHAQPTGRKKFDPDAELSGSFGCLTPAFFAHVLGTALVLSPLSWGGAGAVLSGLAACGVFVATIGVSFEKFTPGTTAYRKARRLARFLIWYGLATFAASLAVLCVRDGEGAVWNSVFSVAVSFGGLWVRGSLLGRRRMVAPPLADALTLVLPLLMVLNAVAFMTYPGVTKTAVILTLSALALLVVCMACNRYRTPVLLNLALVIVLLIFLATNNHHRSASALWLTFTGEKQTCRLLVNPHRNTYGYSDDHDYYLCPGEVLSVDRRSVFAPTAPADEVMVRDGTRWTTALLKPSEVKASTAALWFVHLGIIVAMLAVILVIALVRRGRPATA